MTNKIKIKECYLCDKPSFCLDIDDIRFEDLCEECAKEIRGKAAYTSYESQRSDREYN